MNGVTVQTIAVTAAIASNFFTFVTPFFGSRCRRPACAGLFTWVTDYAAAGGPAMQERTWIA
jgi:hypothetical protein